LSNVYAVGCGGVCSHNVAVFVLFDSNKPAAHPPPHTHSSPFSTLVTYKSKRCILIDMFLGLLVVFGGWGVNMRRR
jgi:hypothetical protein